VIEYDGSGEWVRATRGTAPSTVYLDGFGRKLRTVDPVGVETETKYDAEGRVIREGYPFRTADTSGNVNIWTALEYDALGRVTKRTNPDQTFSTRSYGANGSVNIVDENSRTTAQTWQAFGNPDEPRLATLVDADSQGWSHTYSALGRLTSVTNGSISRTWSFDSVKNLLTAESHPESGTTSFTYDAAGVLASKTDANSVTTAYTYDGNDRLKTITAGTRVTTITYEPGSDNRASAVNDFAGILWHYDALTGRLQHRRDTIGDKAFTSVFEGMSLSLLKFKRRLR